MHRGLKYLHLPCSQVEVWIYLMNAVFLPGLMFMGLLVQYLCWCVYAKGHVQACAISWEMSTKALNLGCKLIKAAEQMVQARSGRNETVNGETNRTWQDSCEGFERWPAVRHLPGASHQSRERNRSSAETFEPILGGICVSWCLPPTIEYAAFTGSE